MSKKEVSNNIISLNFLEALFLLFLGLKLGNVIDWSWWWVFSPIWIPLLAGLIIVVVALIIAVFQSRGEEQ